jgi:hypothetical protein
LTKPFRFASISRGNAEFLDGRSAFSTVDDLSKFVGNVMLETGSKSCKRVAAATADRLAGTAHLPDDKERDGDRVVLGLISSMAPFRLSMLSPSIALIEKRWLGRVSPRRSTAKRDSFGLCTFRVLPKGAPRKPHKC